MPYSEELAKAVVHNLQSQLRSNKFCDIIVTVQNNEFKCHRLILCSCSKYFNDILQSHNSDDPLVLRGVSAEIFAQILECIYGGENILTDENASELWRAAHLLKIEFLYKACEQHKLTRLTAENCVEINNLAKKLGSKKVKVAAWSKLVGNFQDVYGNEDFVTLDFDDFLAIVCHEELAVSCEDVVVMAVLKWLNHTPEVTEDEAGDGHRDESEISEHVTKSAMGDSPAQNRKSFVMELLSSCRLFLASGSCLQGLLDTNWVIKNKNVFLLVREALRRHLQPENCGLYCPDQAVHRSNSPLKNVIACVYRHGDRCPVFACNDQTGSWYRLGSQSGHSGECVAARGTDMYFVNSKPRQGHKGLSVTKYNTLNGKWREMPALASAPGQTALICLDHYIYAVDAACSGAVYRFDVLEEDAGDWENVGQLHVPVKNFALAASGNRIVIFGYASDAQEVTIQSFDALTTACHMYAEKLPTSAAGLVTFQTAAGQTHILLSTGDVWRLVVCDRFEIKMVHKGKLYDGELPLLSAVTFKDELFLSLEQGDQDMVREWNTHCIDHVNSVRIVDRPAICMQNAVIPESHLSKDDNYQGH